MASNTTRANIFFFLILTSILGCIPGISTNAQRELTKIEGRISEGVYISPTGLFRVDVPEMYNPFIKAPSVIRDEQRADGGEEVTFSVPDLGEAWRFGSRPLAANLSVKTGVLAELSDQELARWLNTPAKPNVILEEKVQIVDGSGVVRIYHQESGSLLLARRGNSAAVHESALIGVVAVVSKQKNHLLYAVGQFDMPNSGGYFTLETEEGRMELAAEHLRRMRELTASLRLQ